MSNKREKTDALDHPTGCSFAGLFLVKEGNQLTEMARPMRFSRAKIAVACLCCLFFELPLSSRPTFPRGAYFSSLAPKIFALVPIDQKNAGAISGTDEYNKAYWDILGPESKIKLRIPKSPLYYFEPTRRRIYLGPDSPSEIALEVSFPENLNIQVMGEGTKSEELRFIKNSKGNWETGLGLSRQRKSHVVLTFTSAEDLEVTVDFVLLRESYHVLPVPVKEPDFAEWPFDEEPQDRSRLRSFIRGDPGQDQKILWKKGNPKTYKNKTIVFIPGRVASLASTFLSYHSKYLWDADRRKGDKEGYPFYGCDYFGVGGSDETKIVDCLLREGFDVVLIPAVRLESVYWDITRDPDDAARMFILPAIQEILSGTLANQVAPPAGLLSISGGAMISAAFWANYVNEPGVTDWIENYTVLNGAYGLARGIQLFLHETDDWAIRSVLPERASRHLFKAMREKKYVCYREKIMNGLKEQYDSGKRKHVKFNFIATHEDQGFVTSMLQGNFFGKYLKPWAEALFSLLLFMGNQLRNQLLLPTFVPFRVDIMRGVVESFYAETGGESQPNGQHPYLRAQALIESDDFYGSWQRLWGEKIRLSTVQRKRASAYNEMTEEEKLIFHEAVFYETVDAIYRKTLRDRHESQQTVYGIRADIEDALKTLTGHFRERMRDGQLVRHFFWWYSKITLTAKNSASAIQNNWVLAKSLDAMRQMKSFFEEHAISRLYFILEMGKDYLQSKGYVVRRKPRQVKNGDRDWWISSLTSFLTVRYPEQAIFEGVGLRELIKDIDLPGYGYEKNGASTLEDLDFIIQDPEFYGRWKKRWGEAKESLLSDSLRNEIENAKNENRRPEKYFIRYRQKRLMQMNRRLLDETLAMQFGGKFPKYRLEFWTNRSDAVVNERLASGKGLEARYSFLEQDITRKDFVADHNRSTQDPQIVECVVEMINSTFSHDAMMMAGQPASHPNEPKEDVGKSGVFLRGELAYYSAA